MNATAMLSRMFDRWYRRQMARQHLLGRVRLVGKRTEAAPQASTRTDGPPAVQIKPVRASAEAADSR